MRQIVLDTETTGLEPEVGHRVIEIGGVEMINRRLTGRHYHQYINPERDVDEGAYEVHGISRADLVDKPVFSQIWQEFVDFVDGAELIIHNAPFDIGFLEYELKQIKGAPRRISDICSIKDSLVLARAKHPGQKNNLDALCRRYHVDNSQRDLHGALLDAEILADVYLLMTGGQTNLWASGNDQATADNQDSERKRTAQYSNLRVVSANADERSAHADFMRMLSERCGGEPVWQESAASE